MITVDKVDELIALLEEKAKISTQIIELQHKAYDLNAEREKLNIRINKLSEEIKKDGTPI